MTMYTRNFAGNNNTGAGSGSSSGNNVLWMGDVSTRVPDSHSCSAQQVDAAMDEHRLMQSFSELNEPVEYVRVMRPKDGMGASGYAFVCFPDEATAQRVLSHYNGKPIPNCEGKRFRLNSSTRNQQHGHWNRHNNNQGQKAAGVPARASPSSSWQRAGPRPRPPEFTAYIGDMTTDMDDDPFFELFKSSYPSVFAARIMRQPDGTSKNFAFVRFHDEAEYREALTHEDRISLLLGCHIRICKAHPRPPVPRRWPAAQSRLFAPVPDPGPQLIDPSAAKFHTNPALLSANLEQQRMRQSSPSGQQQPQPPLPHSAQPFLPDQMPAVYYIPVPGYPHYADPAYWANQWHELYPQPDVSHAQLFGHAVGLAEAGDTANMQPCHSFARPAWQMHLPPQQAHFLPDQRFVYNTGEVVDAADVAKHSSSAKSDQYQNEAN